MQKEWISLSDASKIYSLSKPTIKKLLMDGDIIAKKIKSGKWLINKKSFDEYLESDFEIIKSIDL